MKGLNDEGLKTEKLTSPEPRYELGELIGKGVYSEVYIAKDNQAGKNVAVKVVRLSPETKNDIEEEYKVMRDLSSHPNLPDFYGIYIKKSTSPTQLDQIWFIMQLCEQTVTDLVKGLINQNKRMSEVHIAYILRETVKAVVHMHEYHVMHRDINGSNLLLTKDGEVKLADFGISKELASTLGKRTTCLGTPAWMAPEVVNCGVSQDTYDNRSDVWSLGITAIELGDGVSPYHGMHPSRALFQIVRNPPPTLYRPANWSQEYNDFVAECLVKNPEHRPYMNELMEHPFLTQLPENDFHLSTELKVLMETVNKLPPDEKTIEMKVNKGVLKKKELEEPEVLILEDLAAIENVTEDEILSQLELRYKRDAFYTYIGDILVFMNPNKNLDIYNFSFQSKYKFKSRCDNEPHIFSVADCAYQDMMHHEADQHVIFSGETMSGKTSQFNMLLKQLLFLGQSANKSHEQILAGIEVIHAFGNAATPSNGNSTRHILHTQVTYSSSGKTTGAIFWLYQLEKWRVTGNRCLQHANFHIFYYFYDSLAKAGTLENYKLEPNKDYRYLRKIIPDSEKDALSPNGPREDLDGNLAKFDSLVNYLTLLQFDTNQTDTIWRSLAAILLLGEIEFIPGEDSKASINDNSLVEKVAELLKVNAQKLSWALCNYCVVENETASKRKHSVQEATRARTTLARNIYSRLVDWIINLINLRLSFNRVVYGDPYCVTLTDYFGFECYKKNGLEQLFANTFNEQMHYYYNQKIFISEMQEQMAEEVETWKLQFNDNKTTMDELMNKPSGIIYLLDEANRGGHDYDFVIDGLNKSEGKRVVAESEHSFSVAHYTGRVTYDSSTMLQKNREFIPPELTEVLRHSKDKEIKAMFSNKLSKTGNLTMLIESDEIQPQASSYKKKWGAALISSDNKKSRRFNTVSKGEFSQTKGIRPMGVIFRALSIELMRHLSEGSSHFIRCIRTGLTNGFQTSLVKQQMRALAVVDTASSRKLGYSHRIAFEEFLKRYKFLAFDFDENVDETMDNCRLLLVRLKLEGYKMGKSKVFLKYYNEEYLSRLYETQVKKIIKVQAMLRSFLAKRNVATKQKLRQDSQDPTAGNEEIEKDSISPNE